MKNILICLALCSAFLFFNLNPCKAQEAIPVPSDSLSIVQDTVAMRSAEIVQKQLAAYNAKDIEVFLSFYANNVKAFTFPEEELYSGKNAMRAGYEAFFKENPDMYCVVLQRMVLQDVVIDHQRITGLANGKDLNTIAIFKIDKGKINRIHFMKN